MAGLPAASAWIGASLRSDFRVIRPERVHEEPAVNSVALQADGKILAGGLKLYRWTRGESASPAQHSAIIR